MLAVLARIREATLPKPSRIIIWLLKKIKSALYPQMEAERFALGT